MKQVKLMGLLSLIVLGFVSCGKPGETASPLDKKSAGESDAGASLTSGTPDPSVWPLGRLASYVIDIKCDKGVVATINGANSKPNSIVLPKDAGKCLGILKSIKLGQRFYTPIRDVTDSDFAEGGKVEFVEKSDASDIMGIVVEKQIAASGTGAGSMVFRFTGITERRSIGKVNNVNNFSVRSIFISSDGQTAKGVMNFYSSQGMLRMYGCGTGRAYLLSGNFGISSEIMDLSKLRDDGLKTLMNSPARPLDVINSRDPGCGYSLFASLPAIERMTMVVKNFEILSVKTTTINVGYSGIPSPTPGPQIAPKPSISYYSAVLPKESWKYRKVPVNNRIYFIGNDPFIDRYQDSEILFLDLGTMKITEATAKLPWTVKSPKAIAAFGSTTIKIVTSYEVISYDTRADTFTSAAIPKFVNPDRLPQNYKACGNKLIFAGAWYGYSQEEPLRVYDAENGVWSLLELPGQRIYFTLECSDRNVYFAGRHGVDIYDFVSNTWSTHQSESKNSIVRNGSKITFCSKLAEINSFEVYDEITKQWSRYSFPVSKRGGYLAYSVGDKIIFKGGEGFKNDKPIDYWGGRLFDIFDLNNKSWSTGSLSQIRKFAEFAANASLGFFAGGNEFYGSNNYFDTIDIYNSVSDEWFVGKLSQASTTENFVTGNKVIFIGDVVDKKVGVKVGVIDVIEIK